MFNYLVRSIAVLSIGLFFSSFAIGKEYPTKPIKMVLGYPAGSGIDTIARELAESLSQDLDVPVIIDNKSGALSNIAANYVVNSEPDGYTLLFTPNSAPVANVHLFKKLPFDPTKDFTAIAPIATLGFIFVVSSESQHNTIDSLTTLLKKEPGVHNYGTGNATGQVFGALYRQLADLDVVNIPYKGVPAAITDLIGGRLDFVVADASLAIPQINGGRIKGLAVTYTDRLPALPDIPTMRESGLEDYELNTWFGILGPANLPEEIVNKLNESIRRILADKKLIESWQSKGVSTWVGEPQELADIIVKDIPVWGEIITKAEIKAE